MSKKESTVENADFKLIDLSSLSTRDEAILVIATKVFARRGYRNCDVQEIADELGIGKATIYRAFGTKEELFFATVDYGMSKLNKLMTKDEKLEKPTTVEGMEECILTFLTYFDQNPDLIELLMQERSEFKHRDSHSYVRHWLSNMPKWSKKLRRGMEEGRIRQMPVEDLIEVMSGLCYGAIFINYFSKKKMNLEHMARSMADVLSFGTLTDEERTRRKNMNKR